MLNKLSRWWHRPRTVIVRQPIANSIPTLIDREYDQRLRERRFLVAGNGGGLIAALSLGGTLIAGAGAGAEGPPLPWPVFMTIVIFTFGLGASGAALFAERAEIEVAGTWLEALEDLDEAATKEGATRPNPPTPAVSLRVQVLLVILDWSLAIARSMLTAGVLVSLSVLLNFTAFP